MSYRATSADPRDRPLSGLPPVRYYPPVVATLLAIILLLLIVGAIALITLLASFTQVGRLTNNDPQASPVTLGACGLVGLVSLGATIFFVVSLIKGVRDLFSPVYYTRGNVADKRVIGGKREGNWLGVLPRYAGSDLQTASQVDDEQQAASTDRSRSLQPRFAPSAGNAPRKPSGYLSVDRISAELAASTAGGPRRTFRIESRAYKTLQAGEEVLIAHSRHLEHIFYIARLKDGEWEAYYNKALI